MGCGQQVSVCSYLDQPGLQPVVYDDVVAVALEAVLVIVHHRLQRERPRLHGQHLRRRAGQQQDPLHSCDVPCLSSATSGSQPPTSPRLLPLIPLWSSEVDAFHNLREGFVKRSQCPHLSFIRGSVTSNERLRRHEAVVGVSRNPAAAWAPGVNAEQPCHKPTNTVHLAISPLSGPRGCGEPGYEPPFPVTKVSLFT